MIQGKAPKKIISRLRLSSGTAVSEWVKRRSQFYFDSLWPLLSINHLFSALLLHGSVDV